jgi:mono/diheme cytochrome c family protein
MSGGHLFDLEVGKIYSKNINTDKETGIGNLTDGEIARTLRYGVGHDERAILDFMPFQNLSDEDLTAVISYLRSTAPIHNKVPDNDPNIMGNIVMAFMVEPHGPFRRDSQKNEPSPTAEYGKYLANSVANCRGCHTNRDMVGNFIGPDFSGGLKMDVPGKPAYSW